MALLWDLLTRLAVGTILGGIIGYERDIHGRPAGLRTHVIVALASTTFMVVSTHFVYFQRYGRDDLVVVDSSRIAASVVTGIGFLCAGAILRTGIGVQGLTTAAGIWLVSAIGLAAGAGMYAVSVVATAIGVAVLTVLRRFEHKEDHLVRRRISLELDADAPGLASIVENLHAAGAHVVPGEYEKRVDERRVYAVVHARWPGDESERVLALLEEQPGVRRVKVEPMG